MDYCHTCETDLTRDLLADHVGHDVTVNSDNEAKQVIVMRTDLGMRKGKMIAQGAHASMMWLVHRIQDADINTFNDAELAWLTRSFVKVCVRVDSEEELMQVFTAAKADESVGNVYLIEDAGRTEFKGIPTRTCMAIGPAWGKDIDRVTGELKLL